MSDEPIAFGMLLCGVPAFIVGATMFVATPVAVFTPHASADGLVFYDNGEFGDDYADNAFVTLWGTNANNRLYFDDSTHADSASRYIVTNGSISQPFSNR